MTDKTKKKAALRSKPVVTAPVDDFSFALPEDDEFDVAAEITVSQPEPKAEEPEGEKEEGEVEDKPKPEFSEEELLEVFDQILFEGTYTERFSIRGKLPFELQMRSTEDAAVISRRIDKAGFNMIATMEQHVAMLNLAHSLVSFKGEDMTDIPALPKKEGEACRYDFVSKLPGAIVSALYMHLSKFDRKVQLAMMEGQENF